MTATGEGSKPFGTRLREQREMREVSLEEISRVTKISIHLLEAIEEDRWNDLPGGIFTRNFLRLYAKHVGLDPERLVDDFQHYLKAVRRIGTEEEDEADEGVARLEMPKVWLYTLFAVVVLLLVGGYLAIEYLRGNMGGTPAVEPAEPDPTDALPQTPAADEPAETFEGLRLQIVDERESRCWYTWWADENLQTPVDGARLRNNEPVILEAENSIRLFLAHIDGIVVYRDGERIPWEQLEPELRTLENDNVMYIVDIDPSKLRSPPEERP